MRPTAPAAAHTHIGMEVIASMVDHIDSGMLSAASMAVVVELAKEAEWHGYSAIC